MVDDTPGILFAPLPSTRAVILATALEDATAQRALVVEYVRSNMVVDVDYGRVPGTKKDTLLKPGAEKLIELYRCTPELTVIHRVVDYEKGLFHYEVGVTLSSRDSGHVIAAGLGSCSSYESKYRYRNANRKCPKCGKETIIKGKAEYGGGWVCWAPKTSTEKACGAKFEEADASITSQAVGRVDNPDLADVVNTVLKMAKKRAEVDAALMLGGVSDLFTQDVEDAPAPVEAATPVPSKPAGTYAKAAPADVSEAERAYRERLAKKKAQAPSEPLLELTKEQIAAADAVWPRKGT